MLSRRTILAGTLLASLSLGSIALAHAAAASPQTYTLKPSDLGSGFVVTKARVVSNAAMAAQTKVPKVQFDQHGRISGYEVQLEQHSTAEVVFSYAFTYKNAAGAHWDYTHSTAHDLSIGGKRVTATKVGAESLALVQQQKSGNFIVVFYFIDFRQGPVDNAVGIGGLKGKVSVSQAVRYAQIVAAREPKS
jgi:hypothetical protein